MNKNILIRIMSTSGRNLRVLAKIIQEESLTEPQNLKENQNYYVTFKETEKKASDF